MQITTPHCLPQRLEVPAETLGVSPIARLNEKVTLGRPVKQRGRSGFLGTRSHFVSLAGAQALFPALEQVADQPDCGRP